LSGLIAKPIVNDQYWVITDGQKKVGNVQADGSGYEVKINGDQTHFDTTDEVVKFTKIKFESFRNVKPEVKTPYPEYPTTNKVHNSIFDLKRKIHLYTKNKKSKCYHAAGWFAMNTNGNNHVVFCPKYIFIQRYKYLGPYKTEQEATEAINIL